MAQEQEFQEYISVGYSNLYLGAFLALMGGISFLMGKVILYLTGLLLLAIGGFLIYCWFSDKMKTRQQMEAWRSTGAIQDLLTEFQQSGRVFDDTLRLGQTHLFPKGAGKVLTYGELTQVYQYVYMRKSEEHHRELRAMVAGKMFILAKLPLKGTGDADLKKVVAFLLLKNPDIHVGYDN